MAKGQIRPSKEKKKPKADPNKPKKMSAYKAAMMQPTAPSISVPGKKA
jgi:hypothetical protein